MRSRISTFELPRVFRGTDALSAGVLSAAQLRGPSTRRVLRGVYTLAGVPDSHELRCEAAGLVLRAGAQITGTSMATVLGVPLARTADAVQVVVPDRNQHERFRDISFRRLSVPLEPGTFSSPPSPDRSPPCRCARRNTSGARCT